MYCKAKKCKGMILTSIREGNLSYGKIKKLGSLKPEFRLPSKHKVHEFYEVDELFERK